MAKIDKCELCGRINYLNFHHLIPKKLHNKKAILRFHKKKFLKQYGIFICKFDCHKEIHTLHDEKTLGTQLNTIKKLKNDPLVQKYIKFIIKKKTKYSEKDIED
jgi:5-methylcytosine-specific restriction endonuclease McrA